MAYKIYMSDSIYGYCQGKVLGERYFNLINKKVVVDNRSADDIALDVITKAGLVVK